MLLLSFVRSSCSLSFLLPPSREHQSLQAVAELHTAAFEKFLARNWDAAITEFTQVIKQHLRTGYRDRVAALLIQRCKVMKAKSPPASWDGAAEW
jgi:hypothetical protein|tara:strand:- start:1364 stop:1648 length:285 start_codon:yes stop_codon:yes gene_type:complete